MNVEAIGERLYRKVVTAVWSDDRQTYTGGCIVHGENGTVSVRFYRYQIGKGIVGRCKPTDEMSQLLKQYGRELKAYVNRQDEIAAEYIRRRSGADTCQHCGRVTNKVTNIGPPVSGSVKSNETKPCNAEGLRNRVTNEK